MKNETTLKANPTREVRCVTAEDGTRTVVKRFLARGLRGHLQARARARREHRLLTALSTAGLAVPQPLGLTRTAGAWEVRMAWIPEARPLDAALEGTTSVGANAVHLEAVAVLLARIHGEELDHPDLHLGNILVDNAGEPWLVDLHGARLRRSLSPTRLEEDLAAAAAALRELLDAPRRRRMLRCWWRAVSPARRTALGPFRALALRLEEGARAHRRAVVERGAGRWLRTSGRCVRELEGDMPVVRRRDFVPGREETIVVEGHGASLHAPWQAAARLHEHRLPTVVPARLTPRRAEFTLPAGATPPPSPVEEGTDDALHRLGKLLGQLHDRGLDLPTFGFRDLAADGPRGYVLRPPAELLAIDPRPGGLGIDARLRAMAPAPAAAASFRAGYIAALAGGEAERAALTRELLGQ